MASASEEISPFLFEFITGCPSRGVPAFTPRSENERCCREKICQEIFDVKNVTENNHLLSQGRQRESINQFVMNNVFLKLGGTQRLGDMCSGGTGF
jgi:hypothetical protein